MRSGRSGVFLLSIKKGDSVGVLYGQKDASGKWTVGIHNGVFMMKGSKRYHIKHTGNVKDPCDLMQNTRTVYFYYNREDYLKDYQRIKNGTLKGVRIDDIYLLNQIYETQGSNQDYKKNPAIAFALKGQLDSQKRHVVHNGRFVRFEEKNSQGQIVAIIQDYQAFRKKYPTCQSIQNAHGDLVYAHYNLRKKGAGRYEAFQQIPDGVEILNVRNMSASI